MSLTYADHDTAARAVALHAAALDAELWDAARHAFTHANARRLAVRSVALTLDRLEEAERQLELWGVGQTVGTAGEERRASHTERSDGAHAGSPARSRALQRALDRITTRYGARAVTSGAVRSLAR